jgi:hypothetical protein
MGVRRWVKWVLLLLFSVAVWGCGGSSNSVFSTQGAQGTDGGTAGLSLQFDLATTGNQLFRLPAGITNLNIEIFAPGGLSLFDQDLGLVPSLQLEGLPEGEVVVRLVASNADGFVGYFDRRATLVAGGTVALRLIPC